MIRITDSCVGCGGCISGYDGAGGCPAEAIAIVDGVAKIDSKRCVQCGACVEVCGIGAIIDEQ